MLQSVPEHKNHCKVERPILNSSISNSCIKNPCKNTRMVAQPNDGDGSKKSFARSAYAIFARMPMVDHNTNDMNVMKAFNAMCFFTF